MSSLISLGTLLLTGYVIKNNLSNTEVAVVSTGGSVVHPASNTATRGWTLGDGTNKNDLFGLVPKTPPEDKISNFSNRQMVIGGSLQNKIWTTERKNRSQSTDFRLDHTALYRKKNISSAQKLYMSYYVNTPCDYHNPYQHGQVITGARFENWLEAPIKTF